MEVILQFSNVQIGEIFLLHSVQLPHLKFDFVSEKKFFSCSFLNFVQHYLSFFLNEHISLENHFNREVCLLVTCYEENICFSLKDENQQIHVIIRPIFKVYLCFVFQVYSSIYFCGHLFFLVAYLILPFLRITLVPKKDQREKKRD